MKRERLRPQRQGKPRKGAEIWCHFPLKEFINSEVIADKMKKAYSHLNGLECRGTKLNPRIPMDEGEW